MRQEKGEAILQNIDFCSDRGKILIRSDSFHRSGKVLHIQKPSGKIPSEIFKIVRRAGKTTVTDIEGRRVLRDYSIKIGNLLNTNGGEELLTAASRIVFANFIEILRQHPVVLNEGNVVYVPNYLFSLGRASEIARRMRIAAPDFLSLGKSITSNTRLIGLQKVINKKGVLTGFCFDEENYDCSVFHQKDSKKIILGAVVDDAVFTGRSMWLLAKDFFREQKIIILGAMCFFDQFPKQSWPFGFPINIALVKRNLKREYL